MPQYSFVITCKRIAVDSLLGLLKPINSSIITGPMARFLLNVLATVVAAVLAALIIRYFNV